MLRTHQERSVQLGSENEVLQQQLQERLQELEKTKVGPVGCVTLWSGVSPCGQVCNRESDG